MAEEEKKRFNQEQYDFLKKCSDKKDMTEWNQWRKDNQDAVIELEGISRANFYDWYLKGVHLHAYPNKSGKVYLRQADFQTANLRGASFAYAHLEGALFGCADLQNADFRSTHLENAHLTPSNLKGTDFTESHLENATFRAVVLDGETKFWNCTISKCVSSNVRGTDFTGSQLNAVRISPGTKQLLEYNIRRMNWEDWYEKNWLWQWPIKLFWLISNYGISTGRILLTFLILAVAFTFVYWLWPCCVMVNAEVGDIRGFVHALYFSVVTMTTLGFGDIAANPDSWLGQVVLMVQVIFGYALLGALVTRLAVLFTSDGPAGKFTPMDKETKALLKKLKEDKKKASC